jgi:hypothetical protein
MDPCSNFSKEINDGEFTQVYIHYNLGEREADMDLKLFLDTLYATHEADHNKIPYYNIKIKVKPPNGDWIEIGEYKFGSADLIDVYPEEQSITIDTSYTGIGENTILLEDANPPWSDHWLTWDSLKLEAFTHPRPDLVPMSVSFNPPNPREGDSVTITANIRNDGQIDANNVIVNFYYDEDGKSILIATDKVPSIPVSSSEISSVYWVTNNIKGEHIVTVIVDPDNQIKESDEGNNTLTKRITIMPMPTSYTPYIVAVISAISAIIAAGITSKFTKKRR